MYIEKKHGGKNVYIKKKQNKKNTVEKMYIEKNRIKKNTVVYRKTT